MSGTSALAETNPSSADLTTGKRLFERHCSVCHGMNAKGNRGPDLTRHHLLHAPDDAALKSAIAEGIPPEMPAAWFLSDEEVANVAAYVRSLGKTESDSPPGDPKRGRLVYANNGCARCHILAGEGTGYGPELTDVGERRSADYIRQAVEAPTAALANASSLGAVTASGGWIYGFLLVEATPSSGKPVRGIRLNEDTFSIQIKDAAGRIHSFRKQELKQLRKLRGESPMPPYKNILSETDLQDLVAYLASQRGAQ